MGGWMMKRRAWTVDQFEAATALDLTQQHIGRGPRTWMASHRVATWLDLGGKATRQLRADVNWLLSLARKLEAS